MGFARNRPREWADDPYRWLPVGVFAFHTGGERGEMADAGVEGLRRSALKLVVPIGVVSLFDRWGLSVLVAVPLLSCLAALFAFSESAALAVAGTVLWGLGIGAQESVVRAAIALMIPAERRGTAYGIFNAVYGIMWFAGSALLGILYDFALGWLVAFSVGAQLIAVPILFAVRHTGRPAARTGPGP